MAVGPEDYIERLYGECVPEFPFRAETAAAAADWKERLKAAFVRDLGGFPAEKTVLKPRLLEETRCDGYLRQRLLITTDRDLDMPLYVLVPDKPKGRLPVVLACHGHGTGGRDNVGLAADGSAKTGDHGYSKSFGLELVRRGFLVAAPELFGFAERMYSGDMNRWPEVRNSCHRAGMGLLMLGKTIAGVRIHDIVRTLDYLETRPEADPERIGCMGISGGGLVCAFSSALDERIKATVVSGYANTFRDSLFARQHCVCNFVPGLLRRAEMPDLIGLIAPRPLFIEAGREDKAFPRAGAEKALAELEKIYRVWGCAENLGRDLFDGGHEISGRLSYDWLAKHLG